MKYIGLISDTHGFFDTKLWEYFKDCDEIWHAGDIGNLQTADEIAAFKPLKAVYGNIDDHTTRRVYPEFQLFTTEDVKVLIIHICGYPDRYTAQTKNLIHTHKPDMVIGGHSHILKVIYDKKLKHLHINPGSAGRSGFHKKRTAIRFKIEQQRIYDMEIIELEERS